MDTPPVPTSSPSPGSNGGGEAPLLNTHGKPTTEKALRNGRRPIKSTSRKWPSGPLNQWTLPVLHQLAKHFPVAVRRIAEIANDPTHKDNFAACKLVVETLVRDGKNRPALGDAGLTIKIEMTHGLEGKKEEKVIEHE